MSIRSEFDTVAIDSAGNSLSGIEVTVKNAGTSTVSTLYSTKAGGGTIGNPITTGANGLVQFWVAPGSYDITFHDTTVPARISDRTFTYEAISGASGGIDWSQIDGSSVVITSSQVQNGTLVDADINSSAAILGSKLDTKDGRLQASTGIIAPNADISHQAVAATDFGWEDLSGTSTTITPDVASYLMCTLVLHATWEIVSPGGIKFFGDLQAAPAVDGSRQARLANLTIAEGYDQSNTVSPYGHLTVSQVYRIALSAASHTVKLQGRVNIASNGKGTINASDTQMLWMLVAQ